MGGKKFYFVFIISFFLSHILNSQILINEGSNKNYSTIADEDLEYGDWIELYNAGSSPVNLENYALSDDIDETDKWRFLPYTIGAGEFITVFCSDKNRFPINNPDFEQVVSVADYNPLFGWNTHQFTNPFYWDGTSSILINICSYSNSGYTSNSVFNQTDTDYPSTVFNYQDGSDVACSFGAGYTANRRPNLKLNDVIIGTGTAQNGNTEYPAPYGNWWWGAKNQMIIPASELISAGLLPGNINSLSFDVADSLSNTVYTYIDFNFKLTDEIQVSEVFEVVEPPYRFHTNFKISNGGENIYLFSPSGSLLSTLLVDVDMLDVSVGLLNDGSSNRVYFTQPTPGGSNNSSIGYGSTAIPPVFSMLSGIYQTPLNINIGDFNPPSAQSEVRFTRDGNDPTQDSELYTGAPLFIFQSTTLKARIFSPNNLPSTITSASYLIGIDHVTPIISITTDNSNLYGPTGIFDNWQQDWQKAAHVDYFDTDNSLIFSQNSGMQIDGGAGGSRSHPQHSFRLELDNSILGEGPIEHLVIPNRPNRTKYSNFYLRNGSNAYLAQPYKDGFTTMAMSEETNNYFSAMRPVTVYINGGYFGLYELREKFDSEYFNLLDGGDKDETDILSLSYWYGSVLRAVQGSVDTFYNAAAQFNALDTENANFWNLADEFFDMTYYTDYVIAESWMGNIDWPQNNIKIYKSDSTNNRYRFCAIDLEGCLAPTGFVDCNFDHIEYLLNQDPNNPFINVFLKSIQNRRFHDYFINRFADNMNTAYRIEKLLALENEFFNSFVVEMPNEYARWGDPNNINQQMNDFYNNHLVLQDQLSQRTGIVRDNIQYHFNLPNQVDLTLDVFPEGAGKINISTVTPDEYPWEGVYFNGIPIKIQAIANPGYNFLHWGNNPLITDTLNAYFLDTLSSNPIAFNAYFEEIDDVGIDDFATSSNWTIYPNPANSQLFIKNEMSTFGNSFTYQVADLTGRIVASGNITNPNMSNRIDISNLAPSVYLLSIYESGKHAKQMRFVKSKG
jgi:hypothetical protein